MSVPQEGYWGLGNTLFGCSPCDCDLGGSQSTTYVFYLLK